MGGRFPEDCKLDGERDWLLGRLEEKPDLTLHALLAELRDWGVSCSTLWRFRAAGISFKLFASGRIDLAGELVAARPDRSPAAGLHRRDLGQNQHGPNARLEPAWHTADGQVPHGHWRT